MLLGNKKSKINSKLFQMTTPKIGFRTHMLLGNKKKSKIKSKLFQMTTPKITNPTGIDPANIIKPRFEEVLEDQPQGFVALEKQHEEEFEAMQKKQDEADL